jgi:hypothetical protein
MFLTLFLVGCMLLAFSLLALLGPNAGRCMVRVWALNLGSICMFAPLLPKLWRAYRVLDNKRLRSVVITNTTVMLQSRSPGPNNPIPYTPTPHSNPHPNPHSSPNPNPNPNPKPHPNPKPSP